MLQEITGRWSNTVGPSMGAVLSSIALQDFGAAFAKSLFPRTGPDGMIALRLSIAAMILLAFQRPWRLAIPRRDWPALLIYGGMLGGISILLYRAFALLPIGITVAIQATGPLGIALLTSRAPLDFLWFTFAVTGLWLLVPGDVGVSSLDPRGMMYTLASAACWACYIAGGKRVSHLPGAQAVSWGMLIGAVVALPFGIAAAGMALLNPHVLAIGILVAILSSVIPNTLEMLGMRRLPHKVLGILLSSAPAFAALAGFLVLHERLLPVQCTAVGLIMVAVGGSALLERSLALKHVKEETRP